MTTSTNYAAFLASSPLILKADDYNFSQLRRAKDTKCIDLYDSMVEELIKIRSPEVVWNKETLTDACQVYRQELDDKNPGTWVYYPWSKRLLHILDEDDFIEVRTNRNCNKITRQQRDLLKQKCIGVIGLSVGQSVALTLAMERVCGEIRIADFDELSLSNLNRLRSGLHHIGLRKSVIVAREIAEMDPYLKVSCFHDGITAGNIDEFLSDNGKVDLVIEECDSIDIKILSRQRAKSLQIPLIMDTSDSGLLDIERFDKEPDRPIMHGLLEGLDLPLEKLSTLTMEEKLAYILPLVGPETMATTLKSSMTEINKTICSWPQLASSVALGDAVATDTARRILLDEIDFSGRFFVDLNQIIDPLNASLQKLADSSLKAVQSPVAATTTKTKRIGSAVFENHPVGNSLRLNTDQLEMLVEAACRAPSTGNLQPWKWRYENRVLSVFADPDQIDRFGNVDNINTHLSIGATLENLVLKAHQLGLEVETKLFPDNTNALFIASIKFYDKNLCNKQQGNLLSQSLVKTMHFSARL